MDLFSNKNDLVHRLVNLILVLWMAGALFFVSASLINLLVKEPTYTFDEYKVSGCPTVKRDSGEEVEPIYYEEQDCTVYYEQYLSGLKDNDYNSFKDLIKASGNVVIVGIYVFFLNRKASK